MQVSISCRSSTSVSSSSRLLLLLLVLFSGAAAADAVVPCKGGAACGCKPDVAASFAAAVGAAVAGVTLGRSPLPLTASSGAPSKK